MRLSRVTMSENFTPSFVSATILSPTFRACLYFADELNNIMVLSIGVIPITSENTPIVQAVPYIEQVPHERQMFSLYSVKVSSVIVPAFFAPIDSFRSGVT